MREAVGLEVIVHRESNEKPAASQRPVFLSAVDFYRRMRPGSGPARPGCRAFYFSASNLPPLLTRTTTPVVAPGERCSSKAKGPSTPMWLVRSNA